MITVRKANDRGHADHGWLQSAHTFSFADYYDPAHTHFRALRVINEDHVAGGTGFGTHPHRDMEILTWILDGALQHEDSMGHTEILRPGEVQVMSAGTGVQHSEKNPDPQRPVHLLQIWIFPNQKNLKPRYAQQKVDRETMRGRLVPIAAPPGEPAVVEIHQDARIYATELSKGQRVTLDLAPGRGAWVQVARGSVRCGTETLQPGDGAAIESIAQVELEGIGTAPAELLVFDLA
ncbi:MAG: pirin family protein [Planctomycetes bacterium]|jgi:redox-sensitive bicupin YhaK (pirin superfamily)|nr:pirin family protein [Planctomycetota bacterium]